VRGVRTELIGRLLALAAIMEFAEIKNDTTEVVLRLLDWQVRFRIRGPGTPQQRRQIGRAISEMVSQTFRILPPRSWITHPGGFERNINRDIRRGLTPRGGPDLDTEAGQAGFEIRIKRLDLGLSQEQLAARAGISRNHLSRIELGRMPADSPSIQRVRWALEYPKDVAM
jgi:DNA-binding XRE family transcriptional regulator